MEDTSTLAAGEALAQIERLLDRVDTARSGVDAEVRLSWVRLARRVQGRVGALAAVLTAEADRAHASERVSGTPLATWLTSGENLSRREAAGAVHRARAIAEHPGVADAATGGRVSVGQAQAMTRVLESLAPQLTPGQQGHAEDVLVQLAGHLDADQLAKSAGQVLAAVAPHEADALQEQRLQREVEAAHRSRSLRFFREGASVRFDGSLPRIEAESWLAQLDAYGQAMRRTAIEERDPGAMEATPEQRRADALIAFIHKAGAARPEPGLGAARVVVTMDYDRLRADATGAGCLPNGDELSAGELRRICCDAELLPVVLGGASEVLDVGRAARLVTPPIRTALTVRDGGCTFPGCDILPAMCDAHHIEPWWAGGATSLSNLTLLCHTHHGLVEPAKYGLRDQWQVSLAEDGVPEYRPPGRLDPARAPRRHRRFLADDDPARLARPQPASGGELATSSPPGGRDESGGAGMKRAGANRAGTSRAPKVRTGAKEAPTNGVARSSSEGLWAPRACEARARPPGAATNSQGPHSEALMSGLG